MKFSKLLLICSLPLLFSSCHTDEDELYNVVKITEFWSATTMDKYAYVDLFTPSKNLTMEKNQTTAGFGDTEYRLQVPSEGGKFHLEVNPDGYFQISPSPYDYKEWCDPIYIPKGCYFLAESSYSTKDVFTWYTVVPTDQYHLWNLISTETLRTPYGRFESGQDGLTFYIYNSGSKSRDIYVTYNMCVDLSKCLEQGRTDFRPIHFKIHQGR